MRSMQLIQSLVRLVFSIVIVTITITSIVYHFTDNYTSSYANLVNASLRGSLPLFRPKITNHPARFPLMRGMQFKINNPQDIIFYFDCIGECGVTSKDIHRMIKYFLGFLTVPQEKLWVNLSPYQQDRIIPDALAQLDIGKDMLIEDYILKQFTAALTNPKTSHGKMFWNEVYHAARHIAKTTHVPLETFYKVWIVPEKAVVYERVKRSKGEI